MNMIRMGPSAWGSGATNRTIYRYDHARDKHRMGHCAWLPKDGDLCLCVGHSGDCFHDYVALRQGDDGKWTKAGEFGAYFFGEKVGELCKRDFHLAQAGEPIEMTPNADVTGLAPRKDNE